MEREGRGSGHLGRRPRPDDGRTPGRAARAAGRSPEAGPADPPPELEAAATHATGTVRTNGIETYYERRGDGPSIVFIHGAVLDHSQWERQAAALSDAYTTVAYDVRGHGRTGGSATDTYSIDLFAEDLDALIAALDLDRPVLCGLSMGGCIAQAYAARYPDSVAGLVLAGTFTTDMSTPVERLHMAVLRAAIAPVRLVGYERVQRAMAWAHERFERGTSGDYEQVERIQTDAPEMATDEFAKVIRSLTNFSATRIDYSRISVPTLVLYGEHEPSFLRRQAGVLEARLSNVTVKMMPGAGHASNLDDPDFFTEAVRDLLDRVADRRSE